MGELSGACLVVVSGLPAAGKTTLSKFLAERLGFVHIWRDGLRRPFDQVFSALTPDSAFLVGRAMDALINDVASSVLAAGHGAVIDSNFNIPEQAAAIRSLVTDQGCPSFEVCLWADTDVLRERFRIRADPPLTKDLEAYFEMVLNRKRVPVLGPPTPTVELDTTDLAVLEGAKDGLAEQIAEQLSASWN